MTPVQFLQDTAWVEAYGDDFRSLRPNQRKFLQVYPFSFTIVAGLEKCGFHPTMHSQWMHKDPVYRRVFRGIEELVTQALEQEAIRRAAVGWDEPVFYKGEAVGTIRRFSDQLLMFTLKARRPDVYRDRATIDLNTPPEPDHESPFRGVSKDGLIEMKQIIARERARAKQIEGQAEVVK